MYSKSFRYPAEGGERYRENVRRNLLSDLGIKLVEEIADTDQHYTIKVDTEDEVDFRSTTPWRRDRVFTARIRVCPVQYRRMEMMIHEQPRFRVPLDEAGDRHGARPGVFARLWKWANEPIVYDGPMPESRPVATAQEPADRDPADDEFWAEQDRAAFIHFQGPQPRPRP
jgi:hypothetical protein